MRIRHQTLLRSLVVVFGLFTPLSSASGQCVGDCNGDGSVTVNEVVTGVNIGLGTQSLDACPSFDANGDGLVTVNEIITAVNIGLGLAGCGAETPTVPPPPTPTSWNKCC